MWEGLIFIAYLCVSCVFIFHYLLGEIISLGVMMTCFVKEMPKEEIVRDNVLALS